MDKYKLKKNTKIENGGCSSEAPETSQVSQKSLKKKHMKKGTNDNDFRNRQFSFRYLLYNSPFYPQRFRYRSRRTVGKYTLFQLVAVQGH